MKKHAVIYTKAGEDIGYGHVVRMGHLKKLLLARGIATSIWTNEAGYDYYRSKEIDSFSRLGGDRIVQGGDIAIVDYMINSDRYLLDLKQAVRKLVVIVGAGHTITPLTRWMADLIVYQTAELEELKDWVPGEKVLQGLEYIMMDPRFAEVEKPALADRDYDFITYFGGGISEKFSEPLIKELVKRKYKVREVFRGSPMHIAMPQARVYLGSMGMTAYEAIVSGTYPIVFNRSEDHNISAEKLDSLAGANRLATNMGLITRPSKKTAVKEMADHIETIYEHQMSAFSGYPPQWGQVTKLDGKGLYRVAREILKDVEA
jgi:spore coat polysaccharide biosynthesis predicted glycosyltransferase SpsG